MKLYGKFNKQVDEKRNEKKIGKIVVGDRE